MVTDEALRPMTRPEPAPVKLIALPEIVMPEDHMKAPAGIKTVQPFVAALIAAWVSEALPSV
jgi:hypothetical protein